ncbi:MAG TPA: class I SAM-dependent methyltransferase, partial [Polyangiaceae bacterium]|nr:class I SAM-dependent methyltransferase [Polyangiaceae bacterium]
NHCRVLELACGDGINVISMGTALPHSEFVGIDLAARAIAAGQELITETGLRNVTLHAGDASSLSADLGKFDYVIAHGVYSWVDDTVRDGLIQSIQEHLAPNGIAYISFSCFPGAYFRQLAREMMSFHTGKLADPAARLAHGIDFLRFARESHGLKSAYAFALDQEIARVTKADPGYVFHDDFSEHNTPVYFAEFAAHLAEHQLRYISDATYDFFVDTRLSTAVRQRLTAHAAGDPIAEQQYLDFVRGTPFRQALVCHRDTAIDNDLDARRLLPLFTRGALQPTISEPNLLDRSKVCFKARTGPELETDEPIAKALLFEVSQAWPAPRRVADLCETALQRVAQSLSGTAAADDYALRVLARTLLSAAAGQILSLWAGELPFAPRCADRPVSSPLARAQARRSDLVTSLRNVTIRLADRPARELLMLSDGSRTREQLLHALQDRFAEENGFSASSFTLQTLDDTLQGLADRGFMLS